MKCLFKILLLLGIGAARVQAQEECLIDSFSAINTLVSGTAGWTFSPVTTTVITHLGCLDDVVNAQGPIEVGLWSSGGSLLGSVSVSLASPLVNATRYQAITPVHLSAGQTCHIGIFSTNGILGVNVAGPALTNTSVTIASAIQLGTSALSDSGFTFPPAPDTNLLGAIYLGANFRFWSAPIIDSMSGDQTVWQGSNVVLTVTAHGTTPFSYQWRLNGTNLPGVTDNPLILPNIQPDKAGGYSVVLTNLAGAATSSVANIKVLATPTLSVSVIRSNVTVSFPSQLNLKYQLESKANLLAAQWVAVGASTNGTGQIISIHDTNSIAATRFYRVGIQ